MTLFQSNYAALLRCYPSLAQRLDAFPDRHRVVTVKARDGGLYHGIERDAEVTPLTDPIAPLSRIQKQLEARSSTLQDLSRPVLLIGLYPGTELLYLYGRGENAPAPHAEQQIYVCIDSMACLQGFLQTLDARAIITSKRVYLFWHQENEAIAYDLRMNPQQSHLFTPLSGSPNGVVGKVIPPFARLVAERQAELCRLQAENNAYYDAEDSTRLAHIIAGNADRKPRLMLPTCSWSTVTQYSSRDTAQAFEASGWEVERLNMNNMLTGYYLAHEINRFKPDVFLFINHLRTEAPDAYPDNMMFVTWIQDTIPYINSSPVAETWNTLTERTRDMIVGYTSQLGRYGEQTGRDFGVAPRNGVDPDMCYLSLHPSL